MSLLVSYLMVLKVNGIVTGSAKTFRVMLTKASDDCYMSNTDPSAGSPTETLLRLLLPLDT